MRFSDDREIQEPRGVVLLHLVEVPTRNQLLGCEFMDGLEHGQAGLVRRISIGRLLKANQTGIVENIEAVEDGERRIDPEADNSLRRIERPAASEHCQSSEEDLFGATEEIMTPGDRSSQRLLSFRAVPATAGEEREAVVQTRQDRFRR